MSTTKAVQIQEFGNPPSVAKLVEVPLPELKPNDVRVRVAFASINPADLNLIEGKYAIRPPLPAVVGGEGAAIVEEAGSAVEDLAPGDHVLLPQGVGVWRERLVIEADQLVAVPREIDLRQAAMLRVNPATAFRMLRDMVTLSPGDWVLQNASNSGVGRAVIQIARHHGIRTINLVRRLELIEELKACGADEVLLDDADAPARIASLTNDNPSRLALNAVGGESALRLANALGNSGTLVTYGAMGRQPMRIPNGLLIFKDIRFRGFWVTQWYRTAPCEERDAMFREIFELARMGKLFTPVERCYPLEQCSAALEHAAKGSRGGKILFAPGGNV